MKNTIMNFRFSFFCMLLFLFQNYNHIIAQDSTKAENTISKPKIIFNNSAAVQNTDSLKQTVSSDSVQKPKIVFKKCLLLDENKITLISEDRFSFGGTEHTVGSDGENLKKAMGNNLEAILLIDKTYGKKTLGTVLMGLGGAIAIASIALQSTWIETNKVQNGNVTYTYYWIPGVTVGLIVGGIGYVQFSSVNRGLHEAVDFFNNCIK